VAWTDVYTQMLESFAAHEERATSRLDAAATWMPLGLLGRINRWEHEREVRGDRHLFSALVSHIGSISLASFSCPAFTPRAASFLPFDAPGSALTLITLQHDHGLEIAASCPAATGHDGKLAQALDAICEQLHPAQATIPETMPAYRSAAGPRVDLPANLTVWSLIAEQAKANASRIALVDGEQRLTYEELHRRAHAAAHRLREAGVAPGDKVAILSARSSDTILAILAIFQAGAAFLPIDPEWPAERIRFVLGDCPPRCIAAADGLATLAVGHATMDLAALCADGDNTLHDIDNPRGSLAYVLYTSGSTGKPKGVRVGHESLLNYVLWSNDAYLRDLDAPCVFPFFTSLAFDLTLTSLFLPLTTGGAIHVFRQADPLSAVSAILRDPAVNAVKLTPSHLWLFWGAGMVGSGIRKLIVGGEALPVSLAKEICAQGSHPIDIYNEYGPTEATVGCIVHRFDPELDRDTYVPIGLPIANTEVLLLDERGKPVPDGTPGEIALAGRCLALGYLERPEEDARFGAHPFDTSGRAYRTGDSGTRRPDGGFDYHGRIDEQVKIRGHRVELGEVEAAIERTGLCSAFAVVAESSAGGTYLAAYVVWRQDASGDQLRRSLAMILPAYMVPARIVALGSLPLNVNGKVDKRALQETAPGEPRAESTPVSASPPQDMETELSEILTHVAGESFAAAPRDTSLLELGLDSLQMMLLLTLAAKRFLPVSSRPAIMSGMASFLRAPTIVNLATHLRQAA
jgi:amino acid adenylation domain-containing protein